MKKIFALITILGLLSFGCSENNSIVNPVDNNTEDISLAKRVHVSPDGLTFSKEIDGRRGGIIVIKTTIDGSTPFKTRVILQIPRRAFEGKKTISLTFNPNSPTIEFGPAMSEFGMEKFKKAFRLSVRFENQWFEDDNGELKFVYFNDDGSTEDVKSRKVGFTRNNNYIFVRNARLEHFSRYGFTK